MLKKTEDDGLSAPDSKAGRLQRACLALLRQHERDGAIPTNVTFLFYELEQQGVIPKAYRDASGTKRARTLRQDISDATMRLRELGLVPWWWLVDETRDDIRIDCWGGEPAPLIICEARSTKGVLERIAARYLAPIAATNGQSGGFLVNEIVPLLEGNERKVLYIGDHELRGPADQIEANTRRYLERHTGREFTPETWSRVALTAKQVNASKRLFSLAITKPDRRYRPPREYQAVECEAVGQVPLQRMLRARLDALLPEPLSRVRVREQAQREKLRAALAKLARGNQ